MKPHDVRLLCTALGFTAIVTREGRAAKKEALDFSKLIEEFCLGAVPEAFEAANGNGDIHEFPAPESSTPESQENIATAQRMALVIVEIYKEKGGCLPEDLIAKHFTSEEIEVHWAMAMALAKVKMNMSDS